MKAKVKRSIVIELTEEEADVLQSFLGDFSQTDIEDFYDGERYTAKEIYEVTDELSCILDNPEESQID